MLIDTHCHITLLVNNNGEGPLSDNDYVLAKNIITEAQNNNVNKLITIGSTNYQDSLNCSLLAKRFEGIFAAIGIFPNDITTTWKNDLQTLAQLIKENEKIVAIGECGLDFHYPDYNKERQLAAFQDQIELALTCNKAIIIHTRQARDETLKTIGAYKQNLPRGIFHCFSEDLNFAKHAIDLGFYLGIPATITYPKNNQLRDIVKAVGLNHIVLETDSPYLPPQHMRGKKNHPQQIATIAEFIAHILNKPIELVAEKTTANAINILKLNKFNI